MPGVVITYLEDVSVGADLDEEFGLGERECAGDGGFHGLDFSDCAGDGLRRRGRAIQGPVTRSSEVQTV